MRTPRGPLTRPPARRRAPAAPMTRRSPRHRPPRPHRRLQPGRRPPQTLRATADAARSRLHHPISSCLDRRVRRHAQRCRLAVSSSARDDHARPATSSLASGPIRSGRAFLRLLRLLGRRRTRHLPVGVQHPPSQRRVLTRVPMHYTLHLTGRPTPTRLDRLHHHPRQPGLIRPPTRRSERHIPHTTRSIDHRRHLAASGGPLHFQLVRLAAPAAQYPHPAAPPLPAQPHEPTDPQPRDPPCRPHYPRPSADGRGPDRSVEGRFPWHRTLYSSSGPASRPGGSMRANS